MHDFRLLLDRVRMFKFFDLKEFAGGFYYLLAKVFRGYVYLCPFIEFALGLGYLTHAVSRFLYAATIGVTIFGSPGVLNSLP
jgi:hypothetical protein